MTRFSYFINLAWIVLGLTLVSTPGWALVDAFQKRYEHALRCYNQGDYETAIREFQTAFAIRQLPRLLFNLGQAHRKLGHAREALGYLQNYLRVQTNPTPEDRAELESYIAATRPLVEIAEAERRKIATQDTSPVDPSAPRSAVLAPLPAPAPPPESGEGRAPLIGVGTPAPLNPAPTAASTEVAPRRLGQKWWFWTILGGTALAVTAVGVGVGLTLREPCKSAPCFVALF